MAVLIGRRANWITINPLEFLLDRKSSLPLMFKDEKIARRFLCDIGVVKEDLEYFEFLEVENCRCKRCGWPVVKSNVKDYVYTCINDDEDLYEFEVEAVPEGFII